MAPNYAVTELTEDDVHAIIGWSYTPPYNFYDMEEESIRCLRDKANLYYAVCERSDEDGEADTLVGYCCFGLEGQVPGGDYSIPALDVGVGMRPDLTGQGRGEGFLAAVLAYGVERFGVQTLRATVAAFNERSLRVCEKHGFRRVSVFESTGKTPHTFVVLVRGLSS